MFENIGEWFMQPTVYIAVGAFAAFVVVKLLISFGIYLFKKHVIDAENKPKT